MTKEKSAKYCFAIVGAGPTGLSAMEHLIFELDRQRVSEFPQLVQFDSTNNFGSGQVYNLAQPSTNWLNISERSLWIKGRQKISLMGLIIPAFPSYHDWIGWSEREISDNDADYYPTRSHIGKYLNLRYLSIASVLENAGILLRVKEVIKKICIEGNQLKLTTTRDSSYTVDQAVLTIGHQPTELSDRLKKWKAHAKDHSDLLFFSEPYPVDCFIAQQQKLKQTTIALRGFGLAMVDVVRALTEGLGGQFKLVDPSILSMSFKASTLMPKRIVPFSLDGLPMAPKPLNEGIDNWFKPSNEDKGILEESLGCKLKEANQQQSHKFLVEAIAKTASNIYLKLGTKRLDPKLSSSEIAALVTNWLLDEKTSHKSIVPVDISTVDSMRKFVRMATGSANISLDYCVGQVWRHCQPILYELLSFTKLPVPVILQIVHLDERMKRYTYGPPVASVQQLLALVDAEILTLKVVDDPSVELSEKGWIFKENGNKLLANILINTVLDPPHLLSVNSPIIKNLLKQNIIKEIHEELGASTYSNGFIVNPNGSEKIWLAILGRLANGSIVGIDSLSECFGDKVRKWAQSAVKQYQTVFN